jgi:hypothetical protein
MIEDGRTVLRTKAELKADQPTVGGMDGFDSAKIQASKEAWDATKRANKLTLRATAGTGKIAARSKDIKGQPMTQGSALGLDDAAMMHLEAANEHGACADMHDDSGISGGGSAMAELHDDAAEAHRAAQAAHEFAAKAMTAKK